MKPSENQEQTLSVTVADVGSTALLGTLCFPKRVPVSYEPLKDITAYEVAKLLPLFVNREPLTEDALAALGTAARHLKRLA